MGSIIKRVLIVTILFVIGAVSGAIAAGKIMPQVVREHVTGRVIWIDKNNSTFQIILPNGKKLICKVVGFNLSLTDEQKQKAIKIALNNEKVKRIVDNKNYTILRVGPWIKVTEREAKVIGACIWLKVEDKCYCIGVNFKSGEVDVQKV